MRMRETDRGSKRERERVRERERKGQPASEKDRQSRRLR